MQKRSLPLLCLLLLALTRACASPTHPILDRQAALPPIAQKRTPLSDPHPPRLHVSGYADPVPLPGAVNTAGAEDSPFLLPDGRTLYFFFTPDVSLPAEAQVQDPTSGIWVSQRTGDSWGEPERVWLQDPGKLALDGAPCVHGDTLWFASVREGFTGVNLFQARQIAGAWTNWTYVGDRLMEELHIGEVHQHGDQLYFHADRPDGLGGLDLWVTTREDGAWSDAVNLRALNTPGMEDFPFLTPDGQEIWFTRTVQGTPAVYRSLWEGAGWEPPELVLSQFAGEPTLDAAGNLIFVHHYVENGIMIEADLYIAYRK